MVHRSAFFAQHVLLSLEKVDFVEQAGQLLSVDLVFPGFRGGRSRRLCGRSCHIGTRRGLCLGSRSTSCST